MEVQSDVTPLLVLLGAEGYSETAGQPWLRDATDDDWITFGRRVEAHSKAIDAGVTEILLDGTGRPYFLVAVLPDAPESVRKLARGHLRLLRFE